MTCVLSPRRPTSMGCDRNPLRTWELCDINGLGCARSSIMETHAVRLMRRLCTSMS